jgi:hypothetical protein
MITIMQYLKTYCEVDTEVQSTVVKKNRFNKTVSCYNATNIVHYTLPY